jgi:hypothetical protein
MFAQHGAHLRQFRLADGAPLNDARFEHRREDAQEGAWSISHTAGRFPEGVARCKLREKRPAPSHRRVNVA